MKKTDKVQVTISADTLVLLWHYLNGNDESQENFQKEYSRKLPAKRTGYGQSPQWQEVDRECKRIFNAAGCDMKFNETNTVKLNGEYTAEVLEHTVKIGCSEVSHEKVKELWKAIKKRNKAGFFMP